VESKQITKVSEIVDMAKAGGVVFHTKWQRPCPAAFLQNMQARLIVGFIRRGWLYTYHPKSKNK